MTVETNSADRSGLATNINWLDVAGFAGLHIACIGVFWTGITPAAAVLFVVLYAIRVFGLTAGFHRYLAHRSFKTGRVFQFLLIFMGQMSLQRGGIWWAAKHREHHRDSDLPTDAHSPRHYGFWGSHVGWIFTPQRAAADYDMLRDFTKYPELMWLDRHHYFPGAFAAIVCWLIAGWPGLFFGFFCSTVAVYHVTFMVNSLAHVIGRQRYLTGDDSRNNWWIALLTFGEGWHNNHHHYPGSARQGFFWYEVDISYMVLKFLSWFGIVWDLRTPPETVLTNEKKPSSAIIDKVADHIVSGWSPDAIADRVHTRWTEQGRKVEELRERVRRAWEDAEDYLHEIDFPELPSADEIRTRARGMFANTPSLDEAVERARLRLIEAVSRHLMLPQPAAA